MEGGKGTGSGLSQTSAELCEGINELEFFFDEVLEEPDAPGGTKPKGTNGNGMMCQMTSHSLWDGDEGLGHCPVGEVAEQRWQDEPPLQLVEVTPWPSMITTWATIAAVVSTSAATPPLLCMTDLCPAWNNISQY